jgi:hypothetical protein
MLNKRILTDPYAQNNKNHNCRNEWDIRLLYRLRRGIDEAWRAMKSFYLDLSGGYYVYINIYMKYSGAIITFKFNTALHFTIHNKIKHRLVKENILYFILTSARREHLVNPRCTDDRMNSLSKFPIPSTLWCYTTSANSHEISERPDEVNNLPGMQEQS